MSAPAQVDARSADDVLACLLSVIREGPATLIVDLTATAFCDSAGLNSLVQAFRRAGASGIDMRLAVCSPTVRRILEITGIDHLIGTYPSVPGVADRGAGPARRSAVLEDERLRRLAADAGHDRGREVAELDVAVL